jgi:hypothetical protein
MHRAAAPEAEGGGCLAKGLWGEWGLARECLQLHTAVHLPQHPPMAPYAARARARARTHTHTHTHTAADACCCVALSSAGGSASSQSNMWSASRPPQPGAEQRRPVGLNPTCGSCRNSSGGNGGMYPGAVSPTAGIRTHCNTLHGVVWVAQHCAPYNSACAHTVSISKSRTYSVPHLRQRSAKQLPCSSASWARGTPVRSSAGRER